MIVKKNRNNGMKLRKLRQIIIQTTLTGSEVDV